MFTIDDPWPGLIEVGRIARVVGRATLEKLRRMPYRSRLLRRWMTAELRRVASEAERVLFVCKGNICRSPFAEGYARRVLPARIEVTSRGTYREGERRCPAEARFAARQYGVDLAEARSGVLDAESVEGADVILVFDAADVLRVVRGFPGARRKVFRIGPLAAAGPVDLRDPYGGELATFEGVYRSIAAAIDALAEQCFAGQQKAEEIAEAAGD